MSLSFPLARRINQRTRRDSPIIRWSLRLVVHFPSSLRSQIVPVFLYLTLTVRLVLSGRISSMLRRNGWPVYRTAPFGASFFCMDIV